MTDLEQARAEATAQRTAFFAAYREAAISLGSYFRALDRATKLTNETAHANAAGAVLPTERAALAQLHITEPPVRALLDEGYVPVEGLGWNQRCDVVPMVKRISEENHEPEKLQGVIALTDGPEA